MTTHRIELKEEKNGYFTVNMNGRDISYGLTKEQADWFIKGLSIAFAETGARVDKNDEFYEIMGYKN
jgi:hypothetical protein